VVLIDALQLENVEQIYILKIRIESAKVRYGRPIADRISLASLGREWLIEGTAIGTSYSDIHIKERVLMALADGDAKTFDLEDGSDVIPVLITDVKTKHVAGLVFHLHYEIMIKEYDYLVTHQILSATHSDSLAAALVAGDLLIANGTPKLSRLPKGSLGQGLFIGSSGLPEWRTPGVTFIETKTITGALTTSTFSDLDGDTDVVYYLAYRIINGYAGAIAVNLYPNSIMSNQTGAIIYASSAAHGHSALTALKLADIDQNGSAFGTATFYAKTGYLRYYTALWFHSGGYMSSGGGKWTDTATPVTSLDITASQANGLGIGTVISLYKLGT
jgi:hypothetical protein